MDFKQLTQKFIEDAHNILNELENNLLELENKPETKELIEAVFRAMHTLKGVGSMYGFNYITAYTHSLENIYDAIRNNVIKLSPDIFNITFQSVDHLRNLLKDPDLADQKNIENNEQLSAGIEEIINKYSLKINKYKDKLTEKKQIAIKEKNKATWQIIFTITDSIIFRGINVFLILKEIATLGDFFVDRYNSEEIENNENIIDVCEIILISDCSKNDLEEILMFVLDDCKIAKIHDKNIFEPETFAKTYQDNNNVSILEYVENISKQEKNPETIKTPEKTKTQPDTIHTTRHVQQSISVSSEKLDKLMFIVSEMVTLKSELQNAGEKQDIELVMAKVDKFEKLTKLLRNITLSVRLVSLSELTLKFKRLVRDLSVSLNRKVELETQGGDIELDKNLIDLLADPLMHIIRNGIDHGIESPEERLKKGKPETGILKITAFQSGNYVFIQINDDGKGIDKEIIKKKAIEKGIITTDDNLSDKEVYELIFLPGFSTAETLTQVSGRGVGMDVVKRRISEMRGDIDIETEIGKGTTFTIKLQQTLSIIDTLLIHTGNSYFTIPMDEVEVCLQEDHDFIASQFNEQLPYNNEMMPFCYLRKLFKINGKAPKKEKIIVVNKHNKRFALIADTIIGQFQAVVKPVGDTFKNKEYIAGASIMGDGNIAVMLDTDKLIKN